MSTSKRPITVNDVPLLGFFYRKSTWRDMSIKRYLQLMTRPWFYKRTLFSMLDAIQNKYFGRIMTQHSKKSKNFFFMYIGANDGVIGDTIMPYAVKNAWEGILVEPVPHVMRRLKSSFGKYKNFHFEEVAIDVKEGSRGIYAIQESKNQPVFSQMLHSFSEDFVKSHDISSRTEDSNNVVAIKVRTITAKNLLDKYNKDSLDLLVIDTEGFDYEILNNVLDDKIHPKFIKFEYQHMSGQQKNDLKNRLAKLGYRMYMMRGDYFCRRTVS